MFTSPLKSRNNKTQIEEVIFDEEDYDESDDVSIGSLFSSSDSDDNNNNSFLRSEQSNYSATTIVSENIQTPSHIIKRKRKFKNLTYHDVEKSLSQYYSAENTFSSEVDILATYLKGQKNIYIQ